MKIILLDGTEADLLDTPSTFLEKQRYIDAALSALKESKSLDIKLTSITRYGDDFFSDAVINGKTISIGLLPTIWGDEWDKQEDCPSDWPLPKRIIVRIAKLFFDGYKSAIADASADLCIGSLAVADATDLYTYSTAAIDTTNNAVSFSDKLEELKFDNDSLRAEIDSLKAEIDQLRLSMTQVN